MLDIDILKGNRPRFLNFDLEGPSMDCNGVVIPTVDETALPCDGLIVTTDCIQTTKAFNFLGTGIGAYLTSIITSLSSKLQALTNTVNLIQVPKGYVQIVEDIEGTIGVVLTDVPGPVTYQWRFADKDGAFTFTSDTDVPNPTFTEMYWPDYAPIVKDHTVTDVFKAVSRATLLEVVVTDANGYRYIANYNYIRNIYTYE